MARVTSGGQPVVNAIMSQRDREFGPYVLPALRGISVRFPNSDEARHHAYALCEALRFESRRHAGTAAEPAQRIDVPARGEPEAAFELEPPPERPSCGFGLCGARADQRVTTCERAPGAATESPPMARACARSSKRHSARARATCAPWRTDP